MEMKKIIKKEKGLSLLEVIIALYLMAIMIVLVMLFNVYVSGYVKAGENIAIATSFAQRQIEHLKIYNPQELGEIYDATPNLEEKIIYTYGTEYYEYTRTTTISPHNPGLFNVVVKVNWEDKRKSLKEALLETYMKRP